MLDQMSDAEFAFLKDLSIGLAEKNRELREAKGSKQQTGRAGRASSKRRGSEVDQTKDNYARWHMIQKRTYGSLVTPFSLSTTDLEALGKTYTDKQTLGDTYNSLADGVSTLHFASVFLPSVTSASDQLKNWLILLCEDATKRDTLALVYLTRVLDSYGQSTTAADAAGKPEGYGNAATRTKVTAACRITRKTEWTRTNLTACFAALAKIGQSKLVHFVKLMVDEANYYGKSSMYPLCNALCKERTNAYQGAPRDNAIVHKWKRGTDAMPECIRTFFFTRRVILPTKSKSGTSSTPPPSTSSVMDATTGLVTEELLVSWMKTLDFLKDSATSPDFLVEVSKTPALVRQFVNKVLADKSSNGKVKATTDRTSNHMVHQEDRRVSMPLKERESVVKLYTDIAERFKSAPTLTPTPAAMNAADAEAACIAEAKAAQAHVDRVLDTFLEQNGAQEGAVPDILAVTKAMTVTQVALAAEMEARRKEGSSQSTTQSTTQPTTQSTTQSTEQCERMARCLCEHEGVTSQDVQKKLAEVLRSEMHCVDAKETDMRATLTCARALGTNCLSQLSKFGMFDMRRGEDCYCCHGTDVVSDGQGGGYRILSRQGLQLPMDHVGGMKQGSKESEKQSSTRKATVKDEEADAPGNKTKSMDRDLQSCRNSLGLCSLGKVRCADTYDKNGCFCRASAARRRHLYEQPTEMLASMGTMQPLAAHLLSASELGQPEKPGRLKQLVDELFHERVSTGGRPKRSDDASHEEEYAALVRVHRHTTVQLDIHNVDRAKKSPSLELVWTPRPELLGYSAEHCPPRGVGLATDHQHVLYKNTTIEPGQTNYTTCIWPWEKNVLTQIDMRMARLVFYDVTEEGYDAMVGAVASGRPSDFGRQRKERRKRLRTPLSTTTTGVQLFPAPWGSMPVATVRADGDAVHTAAKQKWCEILRRWNNDHRIAMAMGPYELMQREYSVASLCMADESLELAQLPVSVSVDAKIDRDNRFVALPRGRTYNETVDGRRCGCKYTYRSSCTAPGRGCACSYLVVPGEAGADSAAEGPGCLVRLKVCADRLKSVRDGLVRRPVSGPADSGKVQVPVLSLEWLDMLGRTRPPLGDRARQAAKWLFHNASDVGTDMEAAEEEVDEIIDLLETRFQIAVRNELRAGAAKARKQDAHDKWEKRHYAGSKARETAKTAADALRQALAERKKRDGLSKEMCDLLTAYMEAEDYLSTYYFEELDEKCLGQGWGENEEEERGEVEEEDEDEAEAERQREKEREKALTSVQWEGGEDSGRVHTVYLDGARAELLPSGWLKGSVTGAQHGYPDPSDGLDVLTVAYKTANHSDDTMTEVDKLWFGGMCKHSWDSEAFAEWKRKEDETYKTVFKSGKREREKEKTEAKGKEKTEAKGTQAMNYAVYLSECSQMCGHLRREAARDVVEKATPTMLKKLKEQLKELTDEQERLDQRWYEGNTTDDRWELKKWSTGARDSEALRDGGSGGTMDKWSQHYSKWFDEQARIVATSVWELLNQPAEGGRCQPAVRTTVERVLAYVAGDSDDPERGPVVYHDGGRSKYTGGVHPGKVCAELWKSLPCPSGGAVPMETDDDGSAGGDPAARAASGEGTLLGASPFEMGLRRENHLGEEAPSKQAYLCDAIGSQKVYARYEDGAMRTYAAAKARAVVTCEAPSNVSALYFHMFARSTVFEDPMTHNRHWNDGLGVSTAKEVEEELWRMELEGAFELCIKEYTRCLLSQTPSMHGVGQRKGSLTREQKQARDAALERWNDWHRGLQAEMHGVPWLPKDGCVNGEEEEEAEAAAEGGDAEGGDAEGGGGDVAGRG
jgi:hypothetical protein